MSFVIRSAVVGLALLVLAALPAAAQSYHREELRVPMADAGANGLEAVFVRPAAPGRYPLVIISHGAPRNAEQRKTMSPNSYYAHSVEFARRGFAVAAIMRRGYGTSGGEFAEGSGPCGNPDYTASARTSAQDIKAAIKALSARDDVDATRIVAVGQSAGGLATIALAAETPKGLVAAINFAGGRGSRADFEVCSEERLIEAFRTFGKTSRVPMLWVYTANDRYFGPALAEKFHAAFTAGGGRAEFIRAPAFGEDGHTLFARGVPLWTPYVDTFLERHNLKQRDLAPPPALAALTPPRQLSARGREAFERYLQAGPHKAFAVSSDGAFGFRTGQRTVELAKEGAMKLCGEHRQDCRVVFIGDAAAPQ